MMRSTDKCAFCGAETELYVNDIPICLKYSGKNDRRHPYYVCLNAQRKGWAVCPAKSLPARAIEESVLRRLGEAQRGIFDPCEWEQVDRTRQVEAIQSIVERIGYDGVARQISIRFHAVGGPEARA
jgi:hypothetical protein